MLLITSEVNFSALRYRVELDGYTINQYMKYIVTLRELSHYFLHITLLALAISYQ